MQGQTRILCIAGPTASGKSSRAVEIALGGFVNPTSDVGFTKPYMGEVISVDSRQVYRGLDIGTEKISSEEMQGIPHHLIDIREPWENYSAGDFVADATRLIQEISERGRLPILVGGTHYYFDALLSGLPHIDENSALREEFEALSTEELYARIESADQRRASELDPKNRRRLIRALEIIAALGTVPLRSKDIRCPNMGFEFRTSDVPTYAVEWIVIDPPAEELKKRINVRLERALARGLIDEVRHIRTELSIHYSRDRENYGYEWADKRLNELGLEYKIVGEFLGKWPKPGVGQLKETLLPALSAKLWQYARRQKAWLRKLGHPVS